jgi:hypothetical protein
VRSRHLAFEPVNSQVELHHGGGSIVDQHLLRWSIIARETFSGDLHEATPNIG